MYPYLFLCLLLSTTTSTSSSKKIWNPPQNAGITTTFRVESFLNGNWKGAVKWWSNWHCNLLGFKKIYMFADSQYTVEFLNNLNVSCIEAVPAWEWRIKETEDDLHAFITRQTKNCAKAYTKAAKDGLGWLVHMDVDELFYLDGVQTLRHHLKRLSKLKIGSFTYANVEAIATKSTINNYFQEIPVGSFKKHPSMFGLTPQELWESPDSVLNQLGKFNTGFKLNIFDSVQKEDKNKRKKSKREALLLTTKKLTCSKLTFLFSSLCFPPDQFFHFFSIQLPRICTTDTR